MGKSNTEQLKIAAKYLGQGGARFRKYCGLPSGAAWCDAYVTYIFNEAGNASLFCDGKKQTYCPSTIKILQKELAQIPLYLAMPSDVILFDWDRNGVPNHIGFVRSKVSTSTINTIEGNTSNKVMYKTRPSKYVCGIFRPHFKPPTAIKIGKIAEDSEMGFQTIGNLQKVLGLTVDGILGKTTVKKIQAFCGGILQDGSWGPATSKALQTKLAKAGYYTGKIDSDFGPASVKGLQRYINAKNKATTVTKPTTTKPSTTTKPTTKPVTTTKPAAKPAKLKSYKIDIDLTNQICTVYGVYSNKSTKALMSEFISSAKKGSTTPTGNFKITSASGGRKAKLRTAKLSGGTYAEFLIRFHGGKCMHTVPWKKRTTTGKVYKNHFNKLGTKASSGCVRMPWKLAHYIYERCPVGTPVRVFNGKAGAYPMGKPKKYTATANQDPTYKK